MIEGKKLACEKKSISDSNCFAQLDEVGMQIVKTVGENILNKSIHI